MSKIWIKTQQILINNKKIHVIDKDSDLVNAISNVSAIFVQVVMCNLVMRDCHN